MINVEVSWWPLCSLVRVISENKCDYHRHIWHQKMQLYLYCILYAWYTLRENWVGYIWFCIKWLTSQIIRQIQGILLDVSWGRTGIQLLEFDFYDNSLKMTSRTMFYWIWLISGVWWIACYCNKYVTCA